MQDCLTAAILVSWLFSRVSLRKNATKPSIKVMIETLKLMRFIEMLMIDFPFEDIVSQQTLPPWSTISPLWDDYCEKRCITQSIKRVTPLSVTPWHALHNGLEKFQALGRDQREINMYKGNGKRQGWSNSWRNIYYFVHISIGTAFLHQRVTNLYLKKWKNCTISLPRRIFIVHDTELNELRMKNNISDCGLPVCTQFLVFDDRSFRRSNKMNHFHKWYPKI